MAESPKIYTGKDGKQVRVRICDSCKKPFEWSRDSWVFGSLKDEEDCNWAAMRIGCSARCRLDLQPLGEADFEPLRR